MNKTVSKINVRPMMNSKNKISRNILQKERLVKIEICQAMKLKLVQIIFYEIQRPRNIHNRSIPVLIKV